MRGNTIRFIGISHTYINFIQSLAESVIGRGRRDADEERKFKLDKEGQ